MIFYTVELKYCRYTDDLKDIVVVGTEYHNFEDYDTAKEFKEFVEENWQELKSDTMIPIMSNKSITSTAQTVIGDIHREVMYDKSVIEFLKSRLNK